LEKSLRVQKLDSRIHFALNSSVRSRHGVYQFSREAIDHELQFISELYCSSNENITLNDNELILPKFMKAYMSDFASSVPQLSRVICNFLTGERKEKLHAMLSKIESTKTKIKIKFRDSQKVLFDRMRKFSSRDL